MGSEALALYKALLRESGKFHSYIYRTYALRRVRDAFRENRTVQDPEMRKQLLNHGRTSLEIIKRQTVINNLYKDQKLVIEQEGGAK